MSASSAFSAAVSLGSVVSPSSPAYRISSGTAAGYSPNSWKYESQALENSCMVPRVCVLLARWTTLPRAGSSRPISRPMMPMTTSSSTRVKPARAVPPRAAMLRVGRPETGRMVVDARMFGAFRRSIRMRLTD